ncbi:DsbA family oxidoreductase [Chitinophaga lutea]|uniref:DsbA family oxidoreductase n=1 Tax=Chitinophaga lutea TaxID=2488634 RepID=A0A3N4QAI1_9BACT|nr:DsbA family oxidoreductase [Chitinophaga lutea]RPE08744.1 DsbA family oxidoreductase [Chitinophaga lutea]
MKIDIWSDVACPFCFIGKRHLEAALEKFPHRDEVEVTWHSFELDPGAQKDYNENQYELLAKKYGMSPEQAKATTERVEASGAATGIRFDFDKVIPTNTFNAHRLIQLAAQQGKQNEVEELLFTAYFTDGKHIGHIETLEAIGAAAGLDTTGLFTSDAYTDAVRADEAQAQQLGIRGVPFFVFDYKYAVSGAQPVNAFEQTLQKVWEESRPADVAPGAVCEDGTCTTE